MHSSAQSCSSRIARLSRLHERQYMSLSECLQSFAVALSTCAASAASSCSMQCIAKRAKRQSAKSRIGPSHPSPRVVGVVITAPNQKNAAGQNRGRRLALRIARAQHSSQPPVNSPHIAVSARKSSSRQPPLPQQPSGSNSAPVLQPAPKHKHHGWRRQHAGGAGLRLDGGRPQEVV